MAAIMMKNFDVLEYVKLARKFGANEELAELQARQIEQVIDVQNQILESQNQRILEYKSEIEIIKSKEPSTKEDVSFVRRDLDITKLELKDDIGFVRKDFDIVKLQLQKEIETVRKEIEVVRKEIEQAKNQTLVWTFGMLVLFSGAIISVIAKGFHWF